MEPQYGDLDMPTFSMLTKDEVRNDAVCYLTYTNLDTHKLIIDNLSRAPMYNGEICGTGARYCPSIEDKVMRFKDKKDIKFLLNLKVQIQMKYIFKDYQLHYLMIFKKR